MVKFININPGADSTLVTAATRAGIASAPPSYAKTFESVSQNYNATMLSMAKMWGNIAMAGAKIYKKTMNDINEDPPEGVDENTAQEHGSLSNRMAQALGLRPGEDGKRSINLPDYREAKRQRDALNSYAERNSPIVKDIMQGFTSSSYDPSFNSLNTTERMAALARSAQNQTTDYGNYVALSYDDKTKQYGMYYKYDASKVNPDAPIIEGLPFGAMGGVSVDDNGFVLNDKNERILVNPKKLQSNILLNPVNKKGVPIAKVNLNETSKAITDLATKSSTSLENNVMAFNTVKDAVDIEAKNPLNWFTPSNLVSNPQRRSFYNRVTNADNLGPSQISAQLYTVLKDITSKSLDGIEKKGIFKNLYSGDDNMISKEEFYSKQNEDALKRFSLDLFQADRENYDPKLTQALYAFDKTAMYTSHFNNIQRAKNDNSGFVSSVIKAFEQNQKLIPIDKYNTAVLRDTDNKYVVVKNSEMSLDNSDLTGYTKNEMLRRFGGNPTSDDGDDESKDDSDIGGLKIINYNRKEKFGFGIGSIQSIRPNDILNALNTFSDEGEVKTKKDLQTILGKISTDSDYKSKLIKHINKEAGTNIGIKQLDDMIKYLMKNSTDGYVEGNIYTVKGKNYKYLGGEKFELID